MRVLSPSPNPAIAAASTDLIVRGPGHTALIGRWDGGGFRQDLGASLTIDGIEVLTSENAGEAALATPALDGGVVGFFMYDADTNAQTSLGLVASAPFLSFTDVFMDAAAAALHRGQLHRRQRRHVDRRSDGCGFRTGRPRTR